MFSDDQQGLEIFLDFKSLMLAEERESLLGIISAPVVDFD